MEHEARIVATGDPLESFAAAQRLVERADTVERRSTDQQAPREAGRLRGSRRAWSPDLSFVAAELLDRAVDAIHLGCVFECGDLVREALGRHEVVGVEEREDLADGFTGPPVSGRPDAAVS